MTGRGTGCGCGCLPTPATPATLACGRAGQGRAGGRVVPRLGVWACVVACVGSLHCRNCHLVSQYLLSFLMNKTLNYVCISVTHPTRCEKHSVTVKQIHLFLLLGNNGSVFRVI